MADSEAFMLLTAGEALCGTPGNSGKVDPVGVLDPSGELAPDPVGDLCPASADLDPVSDLSSKLDIDESDSVDVSALAPGIHVTYTTCL